MWWVHFSYVHKKRVDVFHMPSRWLILSLRWRSSGSVYVDFELLHVDWTYFKITNNCYTMNCYVVLFLQILDTVLHEQVSMSINLALERYYSADDLVIGNTACCKFWTPLEDFWRTSWMEQIPQRHGQHCNCKHNQHRKVNIWWFGRYCWCCSHFNATSAVHSIARAAI